MTSPSRAPAHLGLAALALLAPLTLTGCGGGGNSAPTAPAPTAAPTTPPAPAAPALTGISPTSGGPGTVVTITGTGFANASAVRFGGVNATSFHIVSPTQITAVVPSGSGVGAVTVVTPAGTSPAAPADLFSYGAPPAPAVGAVSPPGGLAGAVVTLTGSGFLPGSTVLFSTVPGTNISVVDSMHITVTAPAGSGAVGVTVTDVNGTSAAAPAAQFTYAAVSSASPASGAAGTVITITGSGLSGATGVNFGSTPGVGFSVNAAGTQITVTVPAGTGSVPVSVLVPGGSVGAGSYQYTRTVTGYVYQSQFGTTGTGTLADPQGVATDSAGNVYVVDNVNRQVVEFNSAGAFVTTLGAGTLNNPYGVALDSAGNVYVADPGISGVAEFSSAGVLLSNIGNGVVGQAVAVAVDGAGNIYIADEANSRIVKFSSAGAFISAFGDAADGATASTGLLSFPFGIATDTGRNVYVADDGNNRIVKFSSTGAFISAFGDAADGATASTGLLTYAYIDNTDSAGNVYVTDVGNNSVVEFSSTGAYLATFGDAADGATGNGVLSSPGGVAVDSAGNAYVADVGASNRVVKYTLQTMNVPAARPRVSAAVRAPRRRRLLSRRP